MTGISMQAPRHGRPKVMFVTPVLLQRTGMGLAMRAAS